jgi:hypothetical protein
MQRLRLANPICHISNNRYPVCRGLNTGKLAERGPPVPRQSSDTRFSGLRWQTVSPLEVL